MCTGGIGNMTSHSDITVVLCNGQLEHLRYACKISHIVPDMGQLFSIEVQVVAWSNASTSY